MSPVRTYDPRSGERGWFLPRVRLELVLFGVALLLLGYFVIVPISAILVASLKPTGLPNTPGWTLAHLQGTLLAPRTYTLLLNTSFFSLGSVFLAVSLGLILAWLVERTDLRYHHVVRNLVVIPLATPPLLFAIGWILLLSPRTGLINSVLAQVSGGLIGPINIYSLPGMIFVQGLALSPPAYLIISPVLAQMNRELEEAAAASGATLVQTWRRVTLPLLRPALLAAGSYLLILSVVVFDVPGIIGFPANIFLFSTAIYQGIHPPQGLPDYGAIASLSFITLTIASVLVIVYLRAIRNSSRFVTVTGHGYRTAPVLLGRWQGPVLLFAALYCLATVLLPVGALLWSSLLPYWSALSLKSLERVSLQNYEGLLLIRELPPAVVHSLLVAVLAASLATAVSLFLSWIAVRSGLRFRWLIDILSVLPTAMPGVIIGVALVVFYLSVGDWVPIYGTIWILVVAYMTEFLSYGTRSMNSSLLQIHPELEEAAKMSGASWWLSLWRVVVPLLRPAVVAVWVWAFTLALRNTSTALILTGRDNTVVSVVIWKYWDEGQFNLASTMGVMLIAFIGVVQGLVFLLGRRRQSRRAEPPLTRGARGGSIAAVRAGARPLTPSLP